MNEQIRLSMSIHNFVRGHLGWEESLRLLEEIVESEEWLNHLEMDMLIYHLACKKRKKEVSKPPFPRYN